MSLGLAVLSAVLAGLMMIALATKWRLPRRLSLVGIVSVALVTAYPFVWIYPLSDSILGHAFVVMLQVIITVALAVGLVLVRFWRDPDRIAPDGDGLIVSPADGKVIEVRRIEDGSTPLVTKGGRDYLLRELTGTSVLTSAATLIGVEMSLLDVHVNRCPVGGQVKMLKHIAGRYMSLGRAESPFVNARHTTIIENASLNLAVVQVASRLVRRVDSYLSPEMDVATGQRLGMIRFGSLVAVVLPQREDLRIEIRPGDRVTAGITVLARYETQEMRGEK